MLVKLLLWLVLSPSHAEQLPTTLPTSTAYLYYSSDGYTGTIPTQYGLLSALRYMDLSYNTLTGSVPTELGGLSRLTRLSASSNELTQVPSELGRNPLLESLRFDNNQNEADCTVPTQLGQLAQLRSVNWYRSDLKGTMPTEIGNWQSLTYLMYMYSNQFSSSLPTQLGSLTRLTYSIDLGYYTGTSSLPTELGQLTAMGFLDLANGRFTGELPTEFGRLTKMSYSYLQLYSNELCGDVPTEVSALNVYDYYITDGNGFGCDCGDDDCIGDDANDNYSYGDDYDYEALSLGLGLGLGLGIPVLVFAIICCSFSSARTQVQRTMANVELGIVQTSSFSVPAAAEPTFTPFVAGAAVSEEPTMATPVSESFDKLSASGGHQTAAVHATAAVAEPGPYQHAVRATPKIDINMGGRAPEGQPSQYSAVVMEPSAAAARPTRSTPIAVVEPPCQPFSPASAPAPHTEVVDAVVAAEVVAGEPAGPDPTSFEALVAAMQAAPGSFGRKRALQAWGEAGGRMTMGQLRSMIDGSSALGDIFRFKSDKTGLVESVMPVLDPGAERGDFEALLETLDLLSFQKTDLLKRFDSRS